MIESLLETAADLALGDNARRRRAISTAYYAAFHALCQLVAEQIAGDLAGDGALYESIYRCLDHRLTDHQARFAVNEATEAIRTTMRDLRERRMNADYRPGSYEVAEAQVADTLTLARRTVDRIAELDSVTARKLAITLAIDIKGRSRERAVTEFWERR